MKLIVAVNEKWGIGKGNDLLYHLPSDMKFFRNTTKGNIIVIGRKTLESFPNAKPLPYRTNVVLTRDKTYQAEDTVILNSCEEVLEYIKNNSESETYICGGEEIYRLFLPYCSEALVTKVSDSCNAEKFMPNLDNDDNWELIEKSETITENELQFCFCTYKNKSIDNSQE